MHATSTQAQNTTQARRGSLAEAHALVHCGTYMFFATPDQVADLVLQGIDFKLELRDLKDMGTGETNTHCTDATVTELPILSLTR